MSDLISFSFESANVRIVKDEKGEPLFVGKDLCKVLGYANHNDAIKQHCKGVAKRYPLQTPGGVQEVRVLTEPDMLRLIVNSKLPAAQKFEAWVFEEALPTLRKTGEYKTPRKRQSAPATIAAQAAALFPKLKAVAECCGITGNAALISANNGVSKLTGVNLLETIGQVHLVADKRGRTYNATEIAKLAGLSGPQEANYLLEKIGYQTKTDGEWKPTPDGLTLGEWYDTGKRRSNGTLVKQWKWFDDAVLALQLNPPPVL